MRTMNNVIINNQGTAAWLSVALFCQLRRVDIVRRSSCWDRFSLRRNSFDPLILIDRKYKSVLIARFILALLDRIQVIALELLGWIDLTWAEWSFWANYLVISCRLVLPGQEWRLLVDCLFYLNYWVALYIARHQVTNRLIIYWYYSWFLIFLVWILDYRLLYTWPRCRQNRLTPSTWFIHGGTWRNVDYVLPLISPIHIFRSVMHDAQCLMLHLLAMWCEHCSTGTMLDTDSVIPLHYPVTISYYTMMTGDHTAIILTEICCNNGGIGLNHPAAELPSHLVYGGNGKQSISERTANDIWWSSLTWKKATLGITCLIEGQNILAKPTGNGERWWISLPVIASYTCGDNRRLWPSSHGSLIQHLHPHQAAEACRTRWTGDVVVAFTRARTTCADMLRRQGEQMILNLFTMLQRWWDVDQALNHWRDGRTFNIFILFVQVRALLSRCPAIVTTGCARDRGTWPEFRGTLAIIIAGIAGREPDPDFDQLNHSDCRCWNWNQRDLENLIHGSARSWDLEGHPPLNSLNNRHRANTTRDDDVLLWWRSGMIASILVDDWLIDIEFKVTDLTLMMMFIQKSIIRK